MYTEWDSNLKADIIRFLNSLQDKSNKYHFRPTTKGLTNKGRNLTLGFSCYAIKCFYMLKIWDEISEDEKESWINYINSFQKITKDNPHNSYIDPVVNNFYLSKFRKLSLKNNLKIMINYFSTSKKRTFNQLFTDTIRAETKQAIATLKEVGSINKEEYLNFPNKKEDIVIFLDSLDWSKPWNAGAQYAALSVFNITQLNKNKSEENSEILYEYLQKITQIDTGFYHSDSEIELNEKINGTMKIITGLDWINKPIHYPEKIIDYCLNIELESESCDIVDLVYVLYKSCKQSNYRIDDIKEYFIDIKKLISKNFDKNSGGFSYSQNKSQTSYYGLKISRGLDIADLHGTTLLLWALTMIYDLDGIKDYKIIKP